MEVVSPPEDTVGCLKFSPEIIGGHEYLLSGDWTNAVRIWKINKDGTSIPQCEGRHNPTNIGAILDIDWHPNGTQVFVASTDGTASLWDLHSQQFMQIAKHDNAVKTIHYVATSNYQCAVTSSWDNTVKFWDLRAPKPCFDISLGAGVHAGDVVYPMAVYATSDKKVSIINLENTPIFKSNETKKTSGFMIGSITGYAGFCHMKQSEHMMNINFRCHRIQPIGTTNLEETYPVTGIAVHPKNQNAFVTIGGDGHYSIWEKSIKGRINMSPKYDNPMTAVDINASGTKLVFATGYDWGKGHAYAVPNGNCKIYLKAWDSNMTVCDITTVSMRTM